MAIPAQLKYIILSILFIIATVNFTRTTLRILESSRRLENTKKEAELLQKEKQDLTEKITYRQTDDYIEEQARNELNLVKPGEEVYLSPETLGYKAEEPLQQPVANKQKAKNYQIWLDLFF